MEKMVESKNYICFSLSKLVPWVRNDGTAKSTLDTKVWEVEICLNRAPLRWWILNLAFLVDEAIAISTVAMIFYF